MQSTGYLCDSAGCLRRDGGMVLVDDDVHQVCLFRAPIWCPPGGGGTGEAGCTVPKSLVHQVSTHQIRRGWREARSSTSQGGAESLTRESKARTGTFLREKLISDPRSVFFLLRGPTRSGERARFSG